MDFFNLLALLGGLALFLYGMNIMGDGLAKTSGGKLERINLQDYLDSIKYYMMTVVNALS